MRKVLREMSDGIVNTNSNEKELLMGVLSYSAKKNKGKHKSCFHYVTVIFTIKLSFCRAENDAINIFQFTSS